MKNAEKWQHPTRFTGLYPDGWAGFTWLDWDNTNKVYHPGEDYNWSDGTGGNADLGQRVEAVANGICIYTGQSSKGYGNMIILKHLLGYNTKRFIKETYGIETDELYSLYAHLRDIKVAVGNEVDMGALIAEVGKSGVTWAHLHFEIYAPIGKMTSLNWRDYPIGWSKEDIRKYYIPPYLFIESTKNQESYDNFMGKSKEYWLQVEKDRESLMKQVGECDTKWAKKLEIERGKTEVEKKKSKQLEAESAKYVTTIDGLEESVRKSKEDFDKKLEKKDNEIDKLKNRIAIVLEDNAENYKFIEALKLVLYTASKWLSKGK